VVKSAVLKNYFIMRNRILFRIIGYLSGQKMSKAETDYLTFEFYLVAVILSCIFVMID